MALQSNVLHFHCMITFDIFEGKCDLILYLRNKYNGLSNQKKAFFCCPIVSNGSGLMCLTIDALKFFPVVHV